MERLHKKAAVAWKPVSRQTSSAWGIVTPDLERHTRLERDSSVDALSPDVTDKVLAICPEFICIEKPDGSRVVQSTPELQRAMAIARFGISDAPAIDTRITQATALLELAEHSAGIHKDKALLLSLLVEAFGKAALAILNTPSVVVTTAAGHQVQSPRQQRQKADCAAESLATSIRNALRGLVNWKFPLPDGRSTQPDGVNLVWVAQLTAKDIFRATLQRPSQQQIRAAMERDGYGFSGHAIQERWENLFARAALDKLSPSQCL
jgi:hypothetical protein